MPNESKPWITIIGDEIQNIRFEVGELFNLAECFRVTGNDKVAKNLELIATNISQSASKIHSSSGEHVTADLKQSEQDTANVINAALAGITLASKPRHFGREASSEEDFKNNP